MTEIEREQRHQRRLGWAEFASGVFGQVCGLTTVLVLAVLARYFVDHGEAVAGAGIVTAGAASIVAVFVTGRLTQRRYSFLQGGQRSADDLPSSAEDSRP